MPVSPGGAAPVSSVFGRTGAVSLLSADVTGALGFTPANKAGDTFTGATTIDAAINTAQLTIKKSGTTRLEFIAADAGGAGYINANVTDWLIQNPGGNVIFNPYNRGIFRLNANEVWRYDSITGAYELRTATRGRLHSSYTGSASADETQYSLYLTPGAAELANYCALGLGRRSSTTGRVAVELNATLPVSTDASRTARGTLSAVDYAATRECIRWEADGSAARLGFYGGSAVTKPTVSGAHGSNAALQSLLSALASLGLITDSSS
jgi:hypothetical protein